MIIYGVSVGTTEVAVSLQVGCVWKRHALDSLYIAYASLSSQTPLVSQHNYYSATILEYEVYLEY
jgi:hypothetical protein